MNAPLSTNGSRPSVDPDERRHIAVPCEEANYRVAFLLLPGFSQLSLSSFLDPLRLANLVVGRRFFEWSVSTPDGNPVECACGISVSADHAFSKLVSAISSVTRPHMVVLCAGDQVETQASTPLINLLRLCRRHKVPMAALGTATWLLAQGGMLNDAPCTIHWEKMPALTETFSRLNVMNNLFVRNDDLITCAGEFASFHLVMELVSNRLGKETASAVCHHTTALQWRSGSDRQWAAGAEFTGASKTMPEIISLMEQHIEDPLPLYDIAQCVGYSRRQIERLFERHVSCSPMRYYLRLRLERAKQLIEHTDMPQLEIAVACGFASASHFSKCFRCAFGRSPAEHRDYFVLITRPRGSVRPETTFGAQAMTRI
ncbi:GlxA family transcriptional regulator [Mesorhizobium sp. 113-3-3]|uniref:GlxA family transcriptional regulator n=1 Tax=Mesorhizobium sp. 113-3-3 TaxID=2744516 RepID=UPI0018ED30E6|nr:GlxA family transcriptional regulator [Mesorhizobium sp. 113-3-3]BCG83598.1 AraC family transcriptional regulator [Mesorhizobium sp. 113-3-3]